MRFSLKGSVDSSPHRVAKRYHARKRFQKPSNGFSVNATAVGVPRNDGGAYSAM